MAKFFTRDSNITAWIIIIIIIIIVIVTVFSGIFFKSEEKIKLIFKNQDILAVYLCGFDDNNAIKGSFVYLFDTKTNKSAIISILSKTYLKFGDNYYTLETALQKKVSNESLLNAISKLIGYDVKYYIFLEKKELIRIIDIIGGFEIYSRQIRLPDQNIFIPDGLKILDGDKTVEYLSFLYSDDLESEYEQLKRIQNYFRSVIKIKKDFYDNISEKIILNYIYKSIHTNISGKEFLIIYQEIYERYKKGIYDYASNLNSLIVYCDKKYLNNSESYAYFPMNSGEWIKGEVNDAVVNLKKIQDDKTISNKLNIEILNGTDIIGLASKARNHLSSFGFEISNVSNAETNDYENTVVIIHSSESKGKKVAELIKCERVVIDDQVKKNIDVTVILGKDFDGKVVR